MVEGKGIGLRIEHPMRGLFGPVMDARHLVYVHMNHVLLRLGIVGTGLFGIVHHAQFPAFDKMHVVGFGIGFKYLVPIQLLGIKERDENEKVQNIPSVQASGNIRQILIDLSKRYQDIIIDAGGRDSPEMRAAMTMTDTLLVPLQASSFDLWTLNRIDELTMQVEPLNPNIQVMVMLSRGSTNPSVKDSELARAFFSEYERLVPLSVEVHDRVVYRRAARDGAGVVEMDDDKAKAEILSVYAEVYGEEFKEVSYVHEA